MRFKLPTIIAINAVSLALVANVMAAQAQGKGTQSFVLVEKDRIQQANLAGQINKRQASDFLNQEAQIMFQEQQALTQNGGRLNPQQRDNIDAQIRSLDARLEQAVHKNNPNAMFLPAEKWQYHGGSWTGNSGWRGYNSNSTQVQTNWQQQPVYSPTQQSYGNKYHSKHHHHHDDQYNNHGQYNNYNH